MRLADKLSYLNRFHGWVESKPVRNNEDANKIRTECKYLNAEYWQKEIIDGYLEGKLNE